MLPFTPFGVICDFSFVISFFSSHQTQAQLKWKLVGIDRLQRLLAAAKRWTAAAPVLAPDTLRLYGPAADSGAGTTGSETAT
jgi:hypothetical protein